MAEPEPIPPVRAATASAAASSTLLLAAFFAIGSAFLFTATHGMVRHLGSTMDPFQIAFISTLFSALFYVPLLMRNGMGMLRTSKFQLHVVRAFFNAAAIVGWYFALRITPLADATALALTGPLFATLGAVLFLGEKIRLRRGVALAIGAAGALVIIEPGFETFSLGYLLVMVNATCGSGSRLFAKYLTRWDSPVTCGAWVAILQTPITLLMAIPVWQTPTMTELYWLAAVGVFVALAQIGIVKAYRLAEVGAIEPLNFVRLIWAALIGLVAFDESPHAATWIGGAIIVAASTYIARRESKAVAKAIEEPR